MATSTENTAQKPVSVEVLTSHLLGLIADVEPFASADPTIPAINCIGLQFAGDDLIAVSTDRYTLGVGRLPIGERLVAPSRSLFLDEIKRLKVTFKPARGSDPLLRLTFGEESLIVSTTAMLDNAPTLQCAFPWSTVKFPPWRLLIDGARKPPTEGVHANLNPEFLARFVAVQRDLEPVHVWPTESNKPWRVTVGDHFTGLIMPVRLDVAEWVPAEQNEEPPAVEVKPRRSRKPAAKDAAA